MPVLSSRTVAALGAAVALASAGCGEPDAVAVAGRTLRLTLSEYRIAPQTVRVAAGRLTLIVRNAGTIVHQLQLRTADGTRTLLSTKPLRPGETVRATVVLAPGTYRDACPLDRAAALGERGEIDAR
jgi:hypothetical protein